MLKTTLLFVLFSFICQVSQAQFDTSFAKSNILKCADSLAYGFKHKDWELFTRYTYPAMIGTIGGKQAFISFISDKFALMPDSAIKKYEPGRVLQVVKSGKDLQALLEINSVIEWQGIRVISTSHIIGESWSNGLYWTFFDSQNDIKLAKTINPGLSDQLVIPPKNEKMEPIVSPGKNKKDAGKH
ncbi:MAG TPA: hypothetical protein PKC72_00770 [Chitinophagaceae bacterium]|nr:hypothetical protein [Chitinophagaceae bacterium]